MRLDHSGFSAESRFNHIGIDRSLSEEINGTDLLGLFLENADELFSDDLALAFGFTDSGQFVQKELLGVDANELHGIFREDFLDLVAFVLAHQAMVHEHACEVLTDGLGHEGGRYGAVDSA